MILVPYPGTPLYARLEREGRLLYGGKWWLHPDYRYNRAAFIPRSMSPEELEESLRRMARSFYSAGSIFGRMLDMKTHLRTPRNMMLYLACNALYRYSSIE